MFIHNKKKYWSARLLDLQSYHWLEPNGIIYLLLFYLYKELSYPGRFSIPHFSKIENKIFENFQEFKVFKNFNQNDLEGNSLIRNNAICTRCYILTYIGDF